MSNNSDDFLDGPEIDRRDFFAGMAQAFGAGTIGAGAVCCSCLMNDHS
ncbi:MAG: hypothetical protein RIC29_09470 [Rhodospirillaceae bacterium]